MRARLKNWYNAWKNRGRTQDHYEFLPAYLELLERPPSPSARITAKVIACSVIVAIVWACLGQLDMHVVAVGKLEVPSRSQEIQPYFNGEVVEIHVRNGQSVKKGDPLLTLNHVDAQRGLQSSQEKLAHQQLVSACYQTLISEDPKWSEITAIDAPESVIAESRLYCQSLWQHYRAQLSEADAILAKNASDQEKCRAEIAVLEKLQENYQQRLAAQKKLTASQVQSREKLLEYEAGALNTDRELTNQRSMLNVLKAEQKSLQQRRASQQSQIHREWHERLRELNNQLPDLQQNLGRAREYQRLQVLRAPLDGIVQKLEANTIGGIVNPNNKILIITPHDAPQIAEVQIKNKDIGFVQVGDAVTIKIDAFPYSRYGTLQGNVKSISRDAIAQERSEAASGDSSYVFPAQITLKQNYIMVDGKKVMLTPGMSIQTNIKVGKRRVIDYVFSPVREYQSEAWREP
ncbi:MAG: HlyD family type I secretion periplasmic adaptor subunit [Candidatus Symbiodolus clandestinus]